MLFKDLQYFLTEEDGRCFQVVNGVVTALANRKPLQDVPIGWMDILVSWELEMKQGLLRSFATPLEFVWDGAEIVGHLALNESMERKVFLLIKKFFPIVTNTEINPLYRFLYRGQLDLSTVKLGDYSVECTIMEGGIYKFLKANAGTANEYPFDDEAIIVKMDGMEIQGDTKWFVAENLNPGSGGYFGLYQLNNDRTIPGLAVFDVQKEFVSGTPDINSLQYFAEATQDVPDITLSGSVPITTFGPDGPVMITLYIFNTQLNAVRDTKDLAPADPYPTGSNVDFSEQLDLIEGDRLFLKFGGAVGYNTVTREFELSLKGKNRYKTTYTKAYRPFDLYRRIVNKTLKETAPLQPGVANSAVSTLLQQNANLCVTCGDANRGIEGAKIKTHLNDFFDAFDAILSARMQVVGDKLQLESKASFFDASDPYHLGEAKDLVATFANDIRGNVVKIGYPKQTIDDVNGRYSFNNTHTYGSPITTVVRNIELISPYLTDPFYIEINRLNLEGKTTTDSGSDNDVMILNVGDPIGSGSEELFGVFYSDGNKIGIGATTLELVTGQKIRITGGANDGKVFTVVKMENVPLVGNYLYVKEAVTDDLGGTDFTLEIVAGRVYGLRRGTYDNAGDPDDFGIPSPTTAFNIEDLTPKWMLLKNGRWLRSLFWQFENDELTFNTTEVNGDLKTVTGGVTIKENANQSILGLGDLLFKPVNLEFEIDVPVDLVEILEANPRRCFSVDWKGTRYVGFLRKAAIAPATRESQSFTLLSAPFNDLSKLGIR